MDPIKEQPVLLTIVPSLKLLTKENNYHLGPERWSVIEVWTMQAWGWTFRYVVFRCYLQLLQTGPARETYGMDGGAAKKNWVKKTLPFKIQALLNVRQYIVWRIPSPQAWGEVWRSCWLQISAGGWLHLSRSPAEAWELQIQNASGFQVRLSCSKQNKGQEIHRLRFDQSRGWNT